MGAPLRPTPPRSTWGAAAQLLCLPRVLLLRSLKESEGRPLSDPQRVWKQTRPR